MYVCFYIRMYVLTLRRSKDFREANTFEIPKNVTRSKVLYTINHRSIVADAGIMSPMKKQSDGLYCIGSIHS